MGPGFQGHGTTRDRLTRAQRPRPSTPASRRRSGAAVEVRMAFRELSMIDVREVLRRWQAGQSARQIANAGVADRKTIGRYLAVACAEGVTQSTGLTDELIATVARIVQE